MGPAARDVELTQLNSTLLPLALQIREIQSDGNCLFRAIADQLRYDGTSSSSSSNSNSGIGTGKNSLDHISLRALAALHIRSHKNDYEPYLEEGTHFPTYCTRIASSTPVDGAAVLWGGQVEIQALSLCLGKVIEVYSADAPVLRMGDPDTTATATGGADGTESGDGGVLRVSYHAHFFALGAHYNSVVQLK
jgi:OTU domain-containing protein 6